VRVDQVIFDPQDPPPRFDAFEELIELVELIEERATVVPEQRVI